MLILIYLSFVAFVFYRQVKKTKSGECPKAKAIAVHAACTLIPILLYGVVFFALVGVEELTDTAIIGEGYARSLVLVITAGIAISLFSSLVLSLVVTVIKTGNSKPM